MCGTRIAENTGCKNDAKNRHLGTIAQLCRAISSQLSMYRQSEKNVKQQYVLHMSPQYGKLRPMNGWDPLASLGHTSKFQRVSSLAFITAVTSLTDANQTLHDVCPSPGLLHYIYIFGSSCPLTEFCSVQNSLWFHLRTMAQVCQAICSQLRENRKKTC